MIDRPEFTGIPKPKFEPGVYSMEFLGITKATKAKWDRVANKPSATETEECLRLTFASSTTGEEITLDVTCSLHPKSRLTAVSKAMGGTLFTQEVMTNPDKFWTVLTSLVGQLFFVNIDNNEKGTWSKIVSIMPATDKGRKKVKSTLEEDDIPF